MSTPNKTERHTTVRKLYWNFEREEAWLNEMAARGLSLIAYRWGTYTFEHTEPGRWIYRLELLPEGPTKPASLDYLQFMVEAGAEQVATYQRWVYFRRSASEGPFDLFSDLDSRIAHYERVSTLFGSLTAAFIPLTAVNLMNLARAESSLLFMAPMLILYFALVGIIATQASVAIGRVKELKKRRQLFE